MGLLGEARRRDVELGAEEREEEWPNGGGQTLGVTGPCGLRQGWTGVTRLDRD